ncbi:Uncharacterised protein [Yersinia pseudotuberculosis]|nr:Uncharacterised protein [Yersinia pseudotuberculosis]
MNRLFNIEVVLAYYSPPSMSKITDSHYWDMCHSFLIAYYWNDTAFLTLSLYTSKMPITAADVLNDRVLPFNNR